MISSDDKEQTSASATTSTTKETQDQEYDELITEWQDMTFEESATSSLIEDVSSTDLKKQAYAVIGLRKLLSEGQDPPISEAVNSGAILILIKLLEYSSNFRIQSEAAWCLSSLCAGTSEETKKVIDYGVIPSFISALKSSHEEVVEQCLWGLGNIAGDSAQLRDVVIKAGAVEPMVKVLENAVGLAVKSTGIWALLNMYRVKPAAPYEAIEKAIPVFCSYLAKEDDPDILTNAAWGLSLGSDEEKGINGILESGVNSHLVRLLDNPFISVITFCLKVIGNITAGSDEQTACILKEKDLFANLFKLIDHENNEIRKGTLWILSNITSGPPAQFESMMSNSKYLKKIIEATRDDDCDINREAALVLSNLTTECNPGQVIRILNSGIYGCLIGLLYSSDAQILLAALKGIENCLNWGKKFNLKNTSGGNKFLGVLENSGGFQSIETLQMHQNSEVYEAVNKLITDHFEFE